MKKILIFGAGRSCKTLIRYLENLAPEFDWKMTIADQKTGHLKGKYGSNVILSELNIKDDLVRENEIQSADLVISMLPARFHKFVAKSCVKFSKPFLSASYESAEMKDLENEIRDKNLLFLNEMGLDPGLDHMSAMRLINKIKNEGHKILCFESFTGGLIAPESDTNPWHYKFTWNPRNVVLAGQDGPAKFIQEGKIKYIPYNRLFRRTELLDIKGYGKFEGYANRDSLKYIEKYNLQGIPTVYRGTLRRPGFCRAWDVFVKLGLTDDSYYMEDLENMTNREFINSFLYYHQTDSVDTKLYRAMHIDLDSEIIGKLNWLGIFDKTPIGLKKGTPAQILEHILKQKWHLEPHDKDMTVMWHKIIYNDKTSQNPVKITSSMVVVGEDNEHTAMSKTVGLPMGVAAKLILTKQLDLIGLYIPTVKGIYEPVLNELENYGIHFSEEVHSEIPGV